MILSITAIVVITTTSITINIEFIKTLTMITIAIISITVIIMLPLDSLVWLSSLENSPRCGNLEHSTLSTDRTQGRPASTGSEDVNPETDCQKLQGRWQKNQSGCM